jgi:hypothetical protein
MDYQDGDDKEQGENEDYSEKHGNDSFPLEEVAEDTVMRDNSLGCLQQRPAKSGSHLPLWLAHGF